jgi:hypothetical protein
MSTLYAWITGFLRSIAEPKMTTLLYVVNLLLAIPLALACRSVLSDGLGSSLAPSNLMSGLDYTVWQDFSNIHAQELSAVIGQLSWVLLLSMFINTFLSGGILSELRARRDKFSASSFFAGCGNYFLRFFRLFLIFGVSLCVFAAFMFVIVGGAVSALIENATSEITDYWVRVGGAVLFLIPVILLLMIADYAKIRVVVNGDRSMLKTAWRATKFVLDRLLRTFSLEMLMLLIPLILFAVYLKIDLAIGMTTGTTILVMFVIQQLFLLSRAWTKVFFFAGEMALYLSLQPIASPVVDRDTSSPDLEAAHV